MSTFGLWQVAQLLLDLPDRHNKDVLRLLRSHRSHTPLAPCCSFSVSSNFIALLRPVNRISKKFIKLTSIHMTEQCIDYIYQ